MRILMHLFWSAAVLTLRSTASPSHATRARDRSVSASSTSSYSTVSSTRSRSRSRSPRRRSSSRSHRRRHRSRSYTRSPVHERSVRRKYRDSPSPRQRGRRLSQTDTVQRTRSKSPPRRVSGSKSQANPPSHMMDYEATGPETRAPSPPRERSLSPFTQRRLMTEAMRRGG